VITHLFADGGRIIASRKTGYAEHLGAKDLQGLVKKLMQEQHKAMFIELRDCVYDEDAPAAPVAAAGTDVDLPPAAASAATQARPAPAGARPPALPLQAAAAVAAGPHAIAAPRAVAKPNDVDALERAAEARIAESALGRRNEPRRGAGRYQQTLPAQSKHASRHPPPASIFGGEVLRGKSLDEVILSYLSDDVGESER
jgi:hypothetical protein